MSRLSRGIHEALVDASFVALELKQALRAYGN